MLASLRLSRQGASVYADFRGIVCTVERRESCMVVSSIMFDCPVDVPYEWGAKLCRDNSRLLTASPVVDRLSIWPVGGIRVVL